jgi:hypothetical protein
MKPKQRVGTWGLLVIKERAMGKNSEIIQHQEAYRVWQTYALGKALPQVISVSHQGKTSEKIITLERPFMSFVGHFPVAISDVNQCLCNHDGFTNSHCCQRQWRYNVLSRHKWFD